MTLHQTKPNNMKTTGQQNYTILKTEIWFNLTRPQTSEWT